MRKIAILTSGGDAPGMNTAIWAIVKAANKKDIETFVVYEGFKGLTEGNIKPIFAKDIGDLFKKGGTSIYSSRFPEFKNEEVRIKAKEQLDKLGIDSLIVIGGDGSFMGAKLLSDLGVKTVGIPGTIDNDIATTDFTIGYLTATETVSRALEKIKDTHESHNRAAIVEVMGRYSGALAINGAIAIGADVLSIPERKLTEEELIEGIVNARKMGKRSVIAVVTEKLYDVQELAKKVEKLSGIETRSTILGHIQRGGEPIPAERILAVRMGVFAVEQIEQNKTGVAINIVNSKIKAIDINTVVSTKTERPEGLLNHYDLIK